MLESLAPEAGFEYSVAVMPITIAALITTRWLARHLEVPEGTSAVVLPGHCQGDLAVVEAVARAPVQRGPCDLRELPQFYGRTTEPSEYGPWDIEIIATVPSAEELSADEILGRAENLSEEGADVVLLAGSGRRWPGLRAIVEELKEEQRRVALANVAPLDLLEAIPAGAGLVFPADFGQEELDRLAEALKDPSPRLFAEGSRLHAVSNGKHLESNDPYDLFEQIQASSDRTFDAARAFYLGYEMAKAVTALTLGKTYRQDEALRWGLLTQRELTRLERRAMRLARIRDGECDEAREYFADEDGGDWSGEPKE